MGILIRMAVRVPKLAALLLLLATLVQPPFGLASAQGGPAHGVLVVIISAQSKLQDLPKAIVKRVFLGEPTTVDGQKLIPFNYAPEDPTRLRFDDVLLGFDTAASGRYWVDRRIRGQGLPPRVVPNAAIARMAVAKLPGGVSYVFSNQLDASVRALRIDGIAPDASNYPLKY